MTAAPRSSPTTADGVEGASRPRASAVPLGLRTTAALVLASAAGLLAFLWPLLAGTDAGAFATDGAPVLLAAVLVAVLLVLAIALGEGALDVKAVAVLGLLAAVGTVLRPLSAGTAGVELVFILIVLGGRVFGPGFGFALGSTTLLTSALLTGGVGPWLPYQMLAASWVGLGAGLLPRRLRGHGEILALAAYGAVAAFVFGTLMNLAFWPFQLGSGTGLSFVAGDPVGANLHRFLLYDLATSLGWDAGRAITTTVGVIAVGRPVLVTLRRAAARVAFAASGAVPEAPTRRSRAGLPTS